MAPLNDELGERARIDRVDVAADLMGPSVLDRVPQPAQKPRDGGVADLDLEPDLADGVRGLAALALGFQLVPPKGRSTLE